MEGRVIERRALAACSSGLFAAGWTCLDDGSTGTRLLSRVHEDMRGMKRSAELRCSMDFPFTSRQTASLHVLYSS